MTTAEPPSAALPPSASTDAGTKSGARGRAKDRTRGPHPAGRPAPGPGAGLRASALRHPVLLTGVVALLAHLVWFFFLANSGGDIAAQDAWAEFVGQHPDSAYNLAWYGGMHPVSYSVVSPYLMSVLGVRSTMIVAGTVSAALTALVLVRVKAVRNPIACSMAGVFAFFCNAMSGRVTFGLGVMFALGAVGAVFCWPRRWVANRWWKAAVAAPLAGLATAASPVAGLFLGIVAVALFVGKRRPGAYTLGLPPILVEALSIWLFPFSGTQPMSIGTAALPFLFAVAVIVLVPKSWKTVRVAAALYGLGTVATWAVNSQIGSNVSRLAMVVGAVLLLAAVPYAKRGSLRWWALLLAFVGVNVWTGFKGVDDMVITAPTASWTRELAPLVHQLQKADADKGRVEVVPARSHREASALSPYVNLARGWNRQADIARNPLFYDDTLTADNYRGWLDRWAVHFVVLPKGRPDEGAAREAALVRHGEPYLHKLWGDANWQLYAVKDPMPMADPPATVDRAGAGELTIHVKQPGRVLIRIPYSPWLGLVDAEGKSVPPPEETAASKAREARGDRDADRLKQYTNPAGCLTKANKDDDGDEWTILLAPKAGVYRLAAPYQLPRGTGCPKELR
ncbi:MFS transporter [Streptomyces sp. 8L]|uniref:MFS transporter n=1 Tax=Streptomyces sp. 8L TaxID=2877242 RepID=UPI0035A8DFAE